MDGNERMELRKKESERMRETNITYDELRQKSLKTMDVLLDRINAMIDGGYGWSGDELQILVESLIQINKEIPKNI